MKILIDRKSAMLTVRYHCFCICSSLVHCNPYSTVIINVMSALCQPESNDFVFLYMV